MDERQKTQGNIPDQSDDDPGHGRIPDARSLGWDGTALLDAETEARLVERWRQHRDQTAANRLVRSYHRLVLKIARRYRGFDVPLPDLVSEGYVGLLKAIERFDPSRGFRLSTYAVWWIRSAISDAAVNGSLVKAASGESGRKLFFNLRRAKEKVRAPADGDLPPEAAAAIARELGVDEADVVRMNQWLSSRDLSIHAKVDRSAETSRELQDLLIDPSQDHEAAFINRDEQSKRRALMTQALRTLSDRERHVVSERWLRDEPSTLADLGLKFGITRERVRQIEMTALEKLRKRTREAARVSGLASGMRLAAMHKTPADGAPARGAAAGADSRPRSSPKTGARKPVPNGDAVRARARRPPSHPRAGKEGS